jgi:hypothetical protein
MPTNRKIKNFLHRWSALAGLVLGLQGCATTTSQSGAAHSTTAAERDTVPYKLSALPGADKESDPENQERRFGIGAAKAKQEEEARRKQEQAKRVDLVEKP